ncbi:MAG TPA: hypothetical protein VHI71_11370 [Actinomycetota bacterium]|nr:hypothetical protein [Actinomycetota bacterium]
MTRPIHGTIEVSSRYLVGYVVGPIGVGQAQLRVTIAGIAGGRDVTVGSFTSETYTVTPAEDEYEVEFEIEPDTALAGARLTELRIGLEVLGPNVNHNFFDADAKSSVTVPLVR